MSKQPKDPRRLSAVLVDLFTARGYARHQSQHLLEEIWNQAVGEPDCKQTRVGELRRGVLDVTVAHSTLLQELSAFRKAQLIETLQRNLPDQPLRDIRFRLGSVSPLLPRGASRPGDGDDRDKVS